MDEVAIDQMGRGSMVASEDSRWRERVCRLSQVLREARKV
jgi:hypothetical protein